MKHITSLVLGLCVFAIGPHSLRCPAAATVGMEVDATDLPRKLLRARMTIPVENGRASFWYPKWIPGIHAPRGPVENLAGLRFLDTTGQPLPWTRDEVNLYRFDVQAPPGTTQVVARLDYICNQPNGNSGGIDSYGNALIGSLNWNTCVLYPDGVRSDAILYQLTLKLPEGWKFATALPVEHHEGSTVVFRPVTLEVLVDSPLIGGPHLRTLEYTPAGFPRVFYHLNSESAAALHIPEAVARQFGSLAEQTARLFRTAPFREYHFLVTASDDFPGMGLEHTASSLNGFGERGLTDEKERRLALDVLPHEIVHAWCGKFRRPAGMVTGNFHDPLRTGLLWIYEGLTQYLGHLLFVRSGFIASADNVDELATGLSRLERQTGRQWRPLEDTARDSWHLRGRSKSWDGWRRGQDYYLEGMYLWLEVDALLRQGTDNQRSLDDFCATFFHHGAGDGLVKPFALDEVVNRLNDLHPHDWRAFFDERVSRPQEAFPLRVVERLGYRLEYGPEPGAFARLLEDIMKAALAYDGLGLGVGEKGNVLDIVPGSPADQAGLAPGLEIAGVNGRKFSLARFREGIADSATRRHVEFLVLNHDVFKTVRVPYEGGARHPRLVRNPDARDLLTPIFAPREK